MPMLPTNCLTGLSFSFLCRRRDPTLSPPASAPIASLVRSVCFTLAGLVAFAVPSPTLAQQAPKPDAVNQVRNVMGFEDLKKDEKCTVEISGSTIRLKGRTSNVELTAASVEDVLTGDDSARLVGGFIGTLTMFAPYESGRFLSLFRKHLDTLTVQYRDAEGGLHGGILAMKPGQAALLKKQMVDAGAHTSLPIEDPAKPAATPTGDKKP